MFAKVLVDVAHSNVDRLFTYQLQEDSDIALGQRVLVPFGAGNRAIEGFVLELCNEAPDAALSIKRIIKAMEPYPALTGEQITLAKWISKSYHCLLVEALRLMIPAQLRGSRVKEKTERIVRLSPDTDPQKAMSSLRKADGSSKAPKQTEVLELICNMNTAMSVADINGFIPSASQAINALIKKGILVDDDFVVYRDPFANMDTAPTLPLPLTKDQHSALETINEQIDSGRGTSLLFGVTGSGKTEVYMQAISHALSTGGQAIVLVPEISLTPQAMQRFKSRFGNRVAVLHSRLSYGERFDEWRRIRLGMVDVVIGARSAVFAPLERVKLIVIDEEHEQSYHSDHTPRYGAAEVAAKRAELSNAALVLGSATPSIAAYRRALSGRYKLIALPERVNKSPLPDVRIVDMRSEFLQGNNSVFSAALTKELARCFDSGEQAILFMNRRGYSTFVSCRGCGYTLKCPDCDVSMTYHKYESVMKCHYCGRTAKIPQKCPQCGKPYLKYFGVGTQQVEEQLKEQFPGVTSLRMDYDTTQGKDAHYRILSRFISGEAQVLIGTQMIAKGLDIPNVTTVGVIAADTMLHVPDYRSAERTFQLLTQVAGRAGRGDRAGSVIVQSYTPEHAIIELAAKQDYQGFYEYEIAARRAGLFPPFSLFIRIMFTGEDEHSLECMNTEFASGLKQRIYSALEAQGASKNELLFIYASAAPMKRRQGLFRFETLMKLVRTKHTADVIDAIYAYYDEHRRSEMGNVEINPGDMF